MAVGLASALIALYGRYRELPGWLTGPATCKLQSSSLSHAPRGSPGRAQQPVGSDVLPLLLAYGLLAGWDLGLLLGGASLALMMSVFLAGSLWKRKLECRICWAGHWANLAIGAILAWKFWITGS